jgi:hypothetical protein
MCKITLALIGAVLIVGSTSQLAFSKERQPVRTARKGACEQFRNANAYANPHAAPDKAASAYSGGMGGWESMSGFN